METIALRQFDPLYIILDSLFLVLFACLLIWKKKYAALIVGLLAGFLYLGVDYGIFHLLFHTRSISEGYSLFWVLFWMSLSYGFTNFVWIWLWVSKDKNLLEWSSLILFWWISCPLITNTFSKCSNPIIIQRTTASYHGYMAIFLFVGYLFLIVWNLAHKEKKERMPMLWLIAMGLLVQFSWELLLLLGGVRSAGFEISDTIKTLITNSILETNLGMPYIYCIYLWFSMHFTEDLKRKEKSLTFKEALAQNNSQKVRTE